ncbi:MAG TPA: septum formation initiator family protein [Bacillota bacterium]
MKGNRFPAGTAARRRHEPARSAVVPLRGRSGQAAAPPEERAAARRAGRRLRVDIYRLVVFIAVVYVVVTAINQELVATRLNRQLGDLESELETVRAQQAALRERITYLQSDSYIVQEARGRFGMAHPGEIRYVIVEEDEAGGESDPPTTGSEGEASGGRAGDPAQP